MADTTDHSSPLFETYARAPLAFERGSGVWLETRDGRRFMDFGGGIAVNCLGHAHPHLVETMKAQGAMTVLVSGGFTFFTGRVADEAGFAAHRGNTLIDDGAALTGEVGMPILGREAKLSALDEFSADAGLSRADSIALGDGANDLAMIQAAGLGIAYRAKPIVAAEAHAAINHTDLHTALFFQGYRADEFITG